MDLNSKQPSPSEPGGGGGPRNSGLDDLITTFVDITTSTADEARFFLESHNFDLDAAVSTFLESSSAPSPAVDPLPTSAVVVEGSLPRRRRNTVTASAAAASPSLSPSASEYKESSDTDADADYDSESDSPVRLRSRSTSPATRSGYSLRARGSAEANGAAAADGAGGAAAFGRRRNSDRFRPSGRRGGDSNSNRKGKGEKEKGKDSDEDEEDPDWTMPEDDNASGGGGGEGKSGMFDWPTEVDTDEVFERARRFEAAAHPSSDQSQPSSSSRSFRGTMRKLTGETKESSNETTHVVTLWKNGFTVNDGPLRRFDNHENVLFIENLKRGYYPGELASPNNQTGVRVDLVKKNENHPEPKIQKSSFVGAGRTLGSSSVTPPLPSSNSASTSTTSSSVCAPNPSSGLVVDENLPTTSIQLRLADGTRLIAQFNLHHTIRDLHAFINASRPGDDASYKLQAMGFPPKQLTDMDQTIEEAGLASSVVIQKF